MPSPMPSAHLPPTHRAYSLLPSNPHSVSDSTAESSSSTSSPPSHGLSLPPSPPPPSQPPQSHATLQDDDKNKKNYVTTASSSISPAFSALSPHVKRLHALLRAIDLSSNFLLYISPQGLRFSTCQTSLLEAVLFLDKSAFFTTWNYSVSPTCEHNVCKPPTPAVIHSIPPFEVSSLALLQTLQIFTALPGLTSSSTSATSLPLPAVCRIVYTTPGAPLQIMLTEANLTTTSSITTYVPASHTVLGLNSVGDSTQISRLSNTSSRSPDYSIPFDRQQVAIKVIMRGSILHDAFMQLIPPKASANDPDVLHISASNTAPHLSLSVTDSHGSTVVDFSRATQTTASTATRNTSTESTAPVLPVLETFILRPVHFRPMSNSTTLVTYRYPLSSIRNTLRAMDLAAKVSLRVDKLGVLSLQFMIEISPFAPTLTANLSTSAAVASNINNITFIDFRIVPLA